jgi:hypothetical protein
MADISYMIDIFMAFYPGHPLYEVTAETTPIDATIDMADISAAIDHFMQSWP